MLNGSDKRNDDGVSFILTRIFLLAETTLSSHRQRLHYVFGQKLEFLNVPCELMEHFSACRKTTSLKRVRAADRT